MNEPLNLWVLASEMHAVASDDVVCPEQAALLGLVRVLPQEYPHITCRGIEISPPPSGSRAASKLIDHLMVEFSTPTADLAIAYRGRQRWVYALEATRLADAVSRPPRLRAQGVYLLIGALHGIGLSLAQYLGTALQAKLALVCDRPLPAPEEWDTWLATDRPADPVQRAIAVVHELEQAGAEVLAVSADIARADQLRGVIEQAEARFGPIHGVIYASPESGDETFKAISELTAEGYAAYLRAKLESLSALEYALEDRSLDFCLLVSSLSSVLGGLGLATYTSANLCMDAFVYQHNQAHGIPWMTVNLDVWRPEESRPDQTRAGARLAELAITPSEGLEVFRRMLALEDVPQIVVSTGDLQNRIAQWVYFASTEDDGAATVKQSNTYHTRPNLLTAYVAPGDEAEQRIAAIWQELLGIEQVGIHDNFFLLGGHSLLGTRLMSRLREVFQIDIPLQMLFEAPTIAEQALAVETMLIMELEALPEDEAFRFAGA